MKKIEITVKEVHASKLEAVSEFVKELGATIEGWLSNKEFKLKNSSVIYKCDELQNKTLIKALM